MPTSSVDADPLNVHFALLQLAVKLATGAAFDVGGGGGGGADDALSPVYSKRFGDPVPKPVSTPLVAEPTSPLDTSAGVAVGCSDR